jgi:hypothetical protein
MPENVESFTLRYRYDRHIDQAGRDPGRRFYRPAAGHIIDLG